MKLSRIVLPLVAGILAASSIAETTARKVLLLPEVTRHMEQAHSSLTAGTLDIAAAHADVILVGGPVNYFIKYENVAQARQAVCERAFQYATSTWQTALDGSIQFHQVTDAAKADLIIRFRPSVQMKKEEVAGFANWKRTINMDGPKVTSCSYKADVQLRANSLDGDPMPLNSLRHSAMHELGHILGLDDSDRIGDVMGPLDMDHPVLKPLGYEVQAVKDLRQEALAIKDQCKAPAHG